VADGMRVAGFGGDLRRSPDCRLLLSDCCCCCCCCWSACRCCRRACLAGTLDLTAESSGPNTCSGKRCGDQEVGDEVMQLPSRTFPRAHAGPRTQACPDKTASWKNADLKGERLTNCSSHQARRPRTATATPSSAPCSRQTEGRPVHRSACHCGRATAAAAAPAGASAQAAAVNTAVTHLLPVPGCR
jgi:hypothetical protein